MVPVTWELLHEALRSREPDRVDAPVSTRAAVAAVLREGTDGLELLFMKRAEQEGDPWSGHISFPGGRAEPGDDTLLQTALRETLEETGIDLARDGVLLGRLDEIQAMARGQPVDLSITPFVFRLGGLVEVTPNHEVVSLHWLQLGRLLASEHRSTLELRRAGLRLELPCLRVANLVIWGLTYRMFDNLRELVESTAAAARRG